MNHEIKHKIIVSVRKEKRKILLLQINEIIKGLRNDELEALLAKMKEWQNLT